VEAVSGLSGPGWQLMAGEEATWLWRISSILKSNPLLFFKICFHKCTICPKYCYLSLPWKTLKIELQIVADVILDHSLFSPTIVCDSLLCKCRLLVITMSYGDSDMLVTI
jgi:hypothetical protein